MKKHLALFAGLLMSMSLLAQNKVNLVVFSEDSEPFYAYVNGVKQNEKPESNVRITGLNPNISLRIVFENKALPELKQNMALEAGFEHTAKIKRDNKQQMKLRYFGQTPIEETASSPGTVPTVAYHSAETSAPAQEQNMGSQTTVTSTTATTRSGNGSGSDNVAVNVNMSGVGISMNVSGMDQGMTMNSTTSTTVTSTSSSSGYSSQQTETTGQTSAPQTAVASTGCAAAMTSANFAKMKKSVEEKPFSDTKMSTAKVATKNNCLSIEQVKEICKLFSMDDDKLAYAKYAYDYCVDKGSYYQVGDVFSFSSTTDEFNKFLEK